MCARRTCWSAYWTSTNDAPASYAARAISRANGACSRNALTTRTWPGCRFTPTLTASWAYLRRRSSAADTAQNDSPPRGSDGRPDCSVDWLGREGSPRIARRRRRRPRVRVRVGRDDDLHEG